MPDAPVGRPDRLAAGNVVRGLSQISVSAAEAAIAIHIRLREHDRETQQPPRRFNHLPARAKQGLRGQDGRRGRSVEPLWVFLAVVAAFVAAARLRPSLLGPMWLRAVVWVAMVVVGLVIVARLWGTVEAYFAYLAAAIVASALVDRALPPNRPDQA